MHAIHPSTIFIFTLVKLSRCFCLSAEVIVNMTTVIQRSEQMTDIIADQTTPGAVIIVSRYKVERLNSDGTFETLAGQDTAG